MHTCFKFISVIAVMTVNVQLIAPVVTGATTLFDTSCRDHCRTNTESNNDFQPSLAIGGPRISQGSGTR